jgi:protein gp37
MTEAGPRWTNEVRTVFEHLHDPLRWKRPLRIFVNSMSDLFHEKLPFHAIDDVFDVMIQAPWHTYQILTKRARRMREYFESCGNRAEYLDKHRGIWMGVSIENREVLDRADELLKVRAGVLWVSAEPLLSALELRPWLLREQGISWLVVGGESGAGARPMDLEWALDLRRQCEEAGAAFFMKQKGEVLARALGCRDRKGADPSEFPDALRVQDFPEMDES